MPRRGWRRVQIEARRRRSSTPARGRPGRRRSPASARPNYRARRDWRRRGRRHRAARSRDAARLRSMRSRAASSCPNRASATPMVLVAWATATLAVWATPPGAWARLGQRPFRRFSAPLGPPIACLLVAAAERRESQLLVEVSSSMCAADRRALTAHADTPPSPASGPRLPE